MVEPAPNNVAVTIECDKKQGHKQKQATPHPVLGIQGKWAQVSRLGKDIPRQDHYSSPEKGKQRQDAFLQVCCGPGEFHSHSFDGYALLQEYFKILTVSIHS